MAELVITHVRYNAAETHIEKVKIGPSKTSTSEQSRTHVIDQLDAKKVIETAPASGSGARVNKVHVNGTYYIRTDANSTAKDNLGNLPKF